MRPRTTRAGRTDPRRFRLVLNGNVAIHTSCSDKSVILLAAVVCFASGCRLTTSKVGFWVVGARAAHDIPVSETVASRTSDIQLSGSQNEALSFRFAVRAAQGPVDRPRFQVSPFQQTPSEGGAVKIPVQIGRLHRVAVDELPGWYIRTTRPDQRELEPVDVIVPLHAPRGGLPQRFAPGAEYTFWADLTIPKGTAAGVYSSALKLFSGKVSLGTIDVVLTVWPMVLPDETDVRFLAEVDHRALFGQHGRGVARTRDNWIAGPRGEDLERLLVSTLRTLQHHGLTPVLPELAPLVRVDATGGMSVDWSAYDAIAVPFLTGQAYFNRIPQPLWPLPSYALFSTADYGKHLSEYLTQCVSHFDEKGWVDRSYVVAPGVTPSDAGDVRRFAELVEAIDSRADVASRVWPQDMTPYGWVDYPAAANLDSVDIWMPPAQFYDPETMAAARAAGQRTWMRLDRPPFSGSTSLLAAPSDQRVLGWQAKRTDAEVVHLGCVNRWPASAGAAAPSECVGHGEHPLLYPGGAFGLDEPVASVKLKQLRRSLQDVAYISLLQDRGLDHVWRTLARSLAPFCAGEAYRMHFADGRPIGWARDETMFDLARDIMAEELASAKAGDATFSLSHTLERTASWRRLMLGTRRLTVRQDGARIRLRGTPVQPEAEIECSLTVDNRTRAPVSGSIEFSDLPAGWTAQTAARAFPSVGPNRTRRVSLTADVRALPSGVNGIMVLPAALVSAAGERHPFPIRLASLTAVPYDGTLAIDGHLGDWPAGAVNVAADFQWITGATAGAGPRRATTCFVMRDGASLYVAVNCEFDGKASGAMSRRNRVAYEDLVPVGEEFIELLLDPLNAGTRSPEDLYHIVVKPSGAYLAEKGIRFDPPCGRSAPWPVDLEVATGIEGDRWTAELRIPLASFGDASTKHAIWGFNVTRVDAAERSLSTWSGAAGNAYDPLSLGNLYLP